MNEPGDRYEQEADQIADDITGMPAPPAGRRAPLRIQRLARQPAGPVDAAPVSVDHALAGPGRPLPPGLRQDMEQRFGHDFSQIRVHVDSMAAESARAVEAQAYTVGRDIVFGAGRYAPHNQAGTKLLVHELVHTIQQEAAARMPTSARRILQRQPQPDPDTGPCPRGEMRLGPGLPCFPVVLPGRKCPSGQVEFGGACVPLRQRPPPLGGTLTAPGPRASSSSSASSAAGTVPVGAPSSEQSAPIEATKAKRGCVYTVTYSNQREVDCDTAFRNKHGRNPPEAICGAALQYDITSVSASGSHCPTKLEGLRVWEILDSNQGCTSAFPGVEWRPGPGCTIGPGGAVTRCTDVFSLCLPTRQLKTGACTEIVGQDIKVGDELAEEHEIIFTIEKGAKGCTGKVERR